MSKTTLSWGSVVTCAGLLLTGGFIGMPADATAVQLVSTVPDGFSNNFAVGQLWLTNTTLVLAQTPEVVAAGALFVNDLFLFGAAHLTISNNMAVYFVNSNNWNLAEVTLLPGASIHQLVGGSLLATPEPNVLLMWLCGGVTVWAARRRRRNRSQS